MGGWMVGRAGRVCVSGSRWMVAWVGGFYMRGSRWMDGHLRYRNRTILVFLIYHAALAGYGLIKCMVEMPLGEFQS